MKMKTIKQEDGLILLKEYDRIMNCLPSYKEMIFTIFMIVLYYSGYCRWLFWIFIGLMIAEFFISLDEISTSKIIKKEIKRRLKNGNR